MVRGAHGYGGPGPCRKVSAQEHEAKQWWLGVLALSEGEPLAWPPLSHLLRPRATTLLPGALWRHPHDSLVSALEKREAQTQASDRRKVFYYRCILILQI